MLPLSRASQAQAGDTGDNESNANQESHFAVRSARRPDALPEIATWQR